MMIKITCRSLFRRPLRSSRPGGRTATVPGCCAAGRCLCKSKSHADRTKVRYECKASDDLGGIDQRGRAKIPAEKHRKTNQSSFVWRFNVRRYRIKSCFAFSIRLTYLENQKNLDTWAPGQRFSRRSTKWKGKAPGPTAPRDSEIDCIWYTRLVTSDIRQCKLLLDASPHQRSVCEKITQVQVKQLAEVLQKLECASQMPESAQKVNRSAIPYKTATSESVSRTIPAPHFSVSEAGNGLESQEPFLLKDAMTCLSGQKVLDFMPRLMTACGRDVVNYEVQGKGKAQSLAAPFAQYIQLLQRSESGEAYFMMSDKLLRPELSDLLNIPEGLSTGGAFSFFFSKNLRTDSRCHPFARRRVSASKLGSLWKTMASSWWQGCQNTIETWRVGNFPPKWNAGCFCVFLNLNVVYLYTWMDLGLLNC